MSATHEKRCEHGMPVGTDEACPYCPEPISLAAMPGSASDYNPSKCLREEVERFKSTNRFTPMDVTGFYIQAAVVLDEHRRMVEAFGHTNKRLAKAHLIRGLNTNHNPLPNRDLM
jgi:hypothetical protein